MIHYFVAQIKINDPIEYEKYLENFDEIFTRFDGEYLAIDESPILLEGRRLLGGINLEEKSLLKLVDSKIFKSGSVALHYLKK